MTTSTFSLFSSSPIQYPLSSWSIFHGIRYAKVYHVLAYEFSSFFTHWKIITMSPIPTLIHSSSSLVESNSSSCYLMIDTVYHEAFAHWIFESALVLPLFHHLKSMYPQLKLCLSSDRMFKRLLCHVYHIPDTDICLSTHISKPNNCCFFPAPTYCWNHPKPMEGYDLLVSEMIDYLHSQLSLGSLSTPNHIDYDYLFLPRQKKENYKGNDRTISTPCILRELETKQQQGNRVMILHTDTISDMIDQIRILHQSKVLILMDGSAFLFNGSCVQGKTILVLESFTTMQRKQLPKQDLVISMIERKNRVVHFETDESLSIFLSSFSVEG